MDCRETAARAGGALPALTKLMNWSTIEGQWQQVTGQLKSKWAKLTDDDLANVAGKKDQLVGKLQQHYGILKDDAEKQLDEWIAKWKPDAAPASDPKAPKSQ